MNFVIEVLQKIFKHDLSTSHNLTLTVHTDGSAVVGVYSFEIAEQKGIETTMLARNNNFPLIVKIEKE
jgi:ATP-dependent Clp protease adaptor protein ClpS